MAMKVTIRTSPLTADQNHSDPDPMSVSPSVLISFTSTFLLTSTEPRQAPWVERYPARSSRENRPVAIHVNFAPSGPLACEYRSAKATGATKSVV